MANGQRQKYFVLMAILVIQGIFSGTVSGTSEVDQLLESQDYSTVMAAAESALQRSDYKSAYFLYERAHFLSGGNIDSLMGKAVMSLELARYCEARELFNQILSKSPGHVKAREFLATLERPTTWTNFSFSSHDYLNDLYKESALGFLLGTQFPVSQNSTAAIHLRHTGFEIFSPLEMGLGEDSEPQTMSQNEAWLKYSTGTDCTSLAIHLAGFQNDSGWNEKGYVFGTVLHLDKILNWQAAGIVTRYVDESDLAQFDLSGTMKNLLPHLNLTSGLSIQDLLSSPSFSYLGSALWYTDNLWARGTVRIGEQIRPVRLEDPSIYNIQQTTNWSAGFEFGVPIGRGWSLSGSLEKQEYVRSAFQYRDTQNEINKTYPEEISHLVLLTAGITYTP